MRVVVAAALLASACNGPLGLDRVGLEPDDIDNDGVAYDNCRAVANADQLDTDEDGIGDACDPCANADTQLFLDDDHDGVDDGCDACQLGPNHDEDGDGLFDACDNCPADPNAMQKDGDADTLGDACDIYDTIPNTTVYFEAFAPPDIRWFSPVPWIAEGDSLRPPGPGPGVSTVQFIRSPEIPVLSGRYWYLDVEVQPLDADVKAYIDFDQSASGELRRCGLECTAGSCMAVIEPADPSVVQATSTVQYTGQTLRLRAHIAGTRFAPKFGCGIVGADTEGTAAELTNHIGFTLQSKTNDVRFTHVHAVR